MGIPESTFLVKKEVARSATIARTRNWFLQTEHTTPSPDILSLHSKSMDDPCGQIDVLDYQTQKNPVQKHI
jgi:hypothetical protein